MITNIILSLLSLMSWNPLPAGNPTAEEQAAKSQAANFKPPNPSQDFVVVTRVETCSNLVNRKLREDERLNDQDVANALSKRKNMRLIEIIRDCGFFMPEDMQVRLMKDELRIPFKHNPADAKEPWYHEQCSKATGLPLKRLGYLTETEFKFILKKVNPDKALLSCSELIAPNQYERWLEHWAIYLIKSSENENCFPSRKQKNSRP